MGKGNASYRSVLKLASIINSLPKTQGKPYQECERDEKARMLLELGWKEMTGSTYTDQWFEDNRKYL